MVDRPGVDMLQGMELTGTNRSCGLTTYISPLITQVRRAAPRSNTHAAIRGAPGEGSSHHKFRTIATPHSKRCLIESRGLSSNERSRDSPESLFDCMLDTKPVVLRTSPVFPGGYTGEVTPVPIPNTEVKLSRANGTAGASLWESRTLPGF